MTWSHPHILSSLAPHIAHTEHPHRVAAARQCGNFMQLGKGSPLQVDAALQILCIEKTGVRLLARLTPDQCAWLMCSM